MHLLGMIGNDDSHALGATPPSDPGTQEWFQKNGRGGPRSETITEKSNKEGESAFKAQLRPLPAGPEDEQGRETATRTRQKALGPVAARQLFRSSEQAQHTIQSGLSIGSPSCGFDNMRMDLAQNIFTIAGTKFSKCVIETPHVNVDSCVGELCGCHRCFPPATGCTRTASLPANSFQAVAMSLARARPAPVSQ